MNLGILLGLVIAAFSLFVWIGRSGISLRQMARRKSKKLGGAVLVGAALFLVFRGHWEIAVPLAGLGWFLVTGTMLPNLHPMSWLPQKLMSQRSPYLAMEGGDGVILAGLFAGRNLSQLSQPDLVRLAHELTASDEAGLALFEKYLDGRFPGWREDMQANPHKWGLGSTGKGVGRSSGGVAENEAYEILGLTPGASAQAITDAHRALIKKLHPDQGGSTYLAARVNEAKAVLMKRHR